MEFKEILKMQKKLDERIIESSEKKSSEVRNERIVALLVELGEFANEYAPFKYWKKSHKAQRDLLVEEFVDGIHFLASLILELDIKNTIFNSEIVSEDLTKQLLHTFEEIIKLKNDFSEKQIRKAFGVYLGNARLLKISNKEINDFYIQKNKVNYKRLENGY